MIDDSSRNISLNETKTSLNESKIEINSVMEEYEKLGIDYPEDTKE
jgi:hypothetical protein